LLNPGVVLAAPGACALRWAGVTLASEILARRMRLPRAETRDVVCERDLAIAMDDGAVLLADRYVAQAARDRPPPTVLVRSRYGRRQVFGLIFGRLLAERGLQVVVSEEKIPLVSRRPLR
jgi:hypothetical protein